MKDLFKYVQVVFWLHLMDHSLEKNRAAKKSEPLSGQIDSCNITANYFETILYMVHNDEKSNYVNARNGDYHCERK